MCRQLASLFPQAPQFRGRRVVTFHNQRDFIFVRHHRYIFEERAGRKGGADPGAPVLARLQECGPRFTLKLLSLQKGTFDSKAGEIEWAHKVSTRRRPTRAWHACLLDAAMQGGALRCGAAGRGQWALTRVWCARAGGHGHQPAALLPVNGAQGRGRAAQRLGRLASLRK